ncbi:hypothetical protein O6H91_10G006600 [Diphasiastrum complanatum]|uniref:Uncharacterized protein n=1 Tax=Diphasiastrum complanatum TaxID=34168 RepID=A0ACC2CDY5_DIPCM|nr:hypothetical protein O6H91_10G006600 [Diphasiastrum complanatum]
MAMAMATATSISCNFAISTCVRTAAAAADEIMDGQAGGADTGDSNNKNVQIYPLRSNVVSPFLREMYEKEAKRNWDLFYKRNANRFFRDRHYLEKEWRRYFLGSVTDSSHETKTVLEVGCGAGNTIFPLFADFPHLFIHACDFSPRAVNLVKSHKDYNESYFHVFVCDVTSDVLTQEVAPSSVDVVTLVFVLSAIAPEKMLHVLHNVKKVLKVVMYLYEIMLLETLPRLDGKDQKIGENFYVRGDGTRAFYFSEESLGNLFLAAGFTLEDIRIHCRNVENRSRRITMHRRWIQGAFCLSSLQSSPSLDTSTSECFSYAVQTEVPPHSSLTNVLERKSKKQSVPTVKVAALEIDLTEGVAAQMFGDPVTFEITSIQIDNHIIHAKILPKELQHTFKSTGFILWESAYALAHLLNSSPCLSAGKTVLELGCGSVALCTLVTSLVAKRVVATDGDLGTLELLYENLKRNSQNFPVEKIMCCQLCWGDQEAIDALKGSNREGFQLVIGTDVTYVAEALPLLFETCRAVLAEPSSGMLEPLVLLCHVIRNVSENEIICMAEKYGFHLYSAWCPQTKEHSFQVNGSHVNVSLSEESMSNRLAFSGALRFMCFGLSQHKLRKREN